MFKHYICTFSLYFQISYAPHIKSCHRYKWAPFAQDLHFTSSEMEKSRGHLRGRAVTMLVRTPGTTSWTTVHPVAPTRKKVLSQLNDQALFFFKFGPISLQVSPRSPWADDMPDDVPEDIPEVMPEDSLKICLKIAWRYAWRYAWR